ncbi:hypothetical protein TWF173_007685 [Orbilia oligospora]|uniref:Uncharacterized protein n=1 Tax=Orbilia oligospora TaxID=2813651 RepID=A0A7C8V4H8_ORBOL|nr:hypothetical protein TWF970_006474 [Orbilia oligospora]KAF3312013.1 hypothetical protein TWF173_007685 [Orbilia oligospora]
MSSSSHNRPVSSVQGGASHISGPANSDKPLSGDWMRTKQNNPGDLKDAYHPSTGRDKSLVDHARKVYDELKFQGSNAMQAASDTMKTGEQEVGGNHLFDKADGTEKEGARMGGMLNKYTDEAAPGESS